MTPRAIWSSHPRGDAWPGRVRRRRPAIACLALGVALVASGTRADERAGGEPGPPFAVQGACEGGAAEAAARRVQLRYDGIRDISADFVQTSESATFGGDPLMSAEPRRGRVVLAKPGRMRWTYETPEPSEVVSDGQTLWIHDVEARSVTRLAVTEGYLTGAALQFLMGEGRILEAFDVEARACQPDRVHLVLRPRDDASYEHLELVATREGDVLATSVADLFGNVTWIRFEGVRVNLDPAAEVFVLRPPDGVEVIEYVPGEAP